MADLSLLCEFRGFAKEGKGCSIVDGLRHCAKRSSPRNGAYKDCTTGNIDTLTEPVLVPANIVTYLNDNVTYLGQYVTYGV